MISRNYLINNIIIKEMVIVAKLTIPCAYQGGKQRIAKQVVEIIQQYINNNNSDNIKFYDMCCGSGAISIELVNQGFNPDNIIMVDKSPWGLFWKMIGDTTFSMDIFKYWIDSIPSDINKIKDYAKELIIKPANDDGFNNMVYKFLFLQACAFGSTATWVENNIWRKAGGLRNYWLPTTTSSRRSPVNPMMPMPNTLYQRVQELSFGMEGVKGYYGDCNDIHIEENSIIYIDPPYINTSGYGFEFDYMKFIDKHKINNIILLSEGMKLSDNNYNLTDRRSKGGISGERKKKANEEWLNVFGKVS